jgi:CopG family transcriptional regulator/antitoxin EndoAI
MKEAVMRTSKILSLSLPPGLLREAERAAQKEGRTKSELFREALRRYLLEEKVRRLQRYGARQAQKLGIKASDVQRIIEEYRKTR